MKIQAKVAPDRPYMTPSLMKGFLIYQLVAPTSFKISISSFLLAIFMLMEVSRIKKVDRIRNDTNRKPTFLTVDAQLMRVSTTSF